jgi:hypothetical protein
MKKEARSRVMNGLKNRGRFAKEKETVRHNSRAREILIILN